MRECRTPVRMIGLRGARRSHRTSRPVRSRPTTERSVPMTRLSRDARRDLAERHGIVTDATVARRWCPPAIRSAGSSIGGPAHPGAPRRLPGRTVARHVRVPLRGRVPAPIPQAVITGARRGADLWEFRHVLPMPISPIVLVAHDRTPLCRRCRAPPDQSCSIRTSVSSSALTAFVLPARRGCGSTAPATSTTNASSGSPNGSSTSTPSVPTLWTIRSGRLSARGRPGSRASTV